MKSIDEKNEKYCSIYGALSCIYGAFLGDAIGSFCEFKKADKNNHKAYEKNDKNIWKCLKGHVTDDSEMAMSMAAGIFDMPYIEKLDNTFIYFYYSTWFKTCPVDFGNTTKNALTHFEEKTKIYESFSTRIETKIANTNFNSLANGSLMRNTPLAVWFYFLHKPEFDKLINDDRFIND
ncbi:MAG: ADP-ribosylglycohydrolase family protein, partial [archaeon]|nr:ADP-ribosylglycohydrolase family protein [archaeon]